MAISTIKVEKPTYYTIASGDTLTLTMSTRLVAIFYKRNTNYGIILADYWGGCVFIGESGTGLQATKSASSSTITLTNTGATSIPLWVIY